MKKILIYMLLSLVFLYANSIVPTKEGIIIKGNGEECSVLLNTTGKIVKTNCLQLTNSKKVKILCTQNKKICKTVAEIRISLFGSTYQTSYNCDKAATQTEKDICHSKVVSSLDYKLGKAYVDMKKMMSKNDFEALQEIQYQWVKDREIKCGKQDTFKKRESCLVDFYRQRMDSFSLISVGNSRLSFVPSFEEIYNNGSGNERIDLAIYYYVDKKDIYKATKLLRKVIGDQQDELVDAFMTLNAMHWKYSKTFKEVTDELIHKNNNSIALALSELGEDDKKVDDVFLQEAHFLNTFAEILVANYYEYPVDEQDQAYRDKILAFYKECADDGIPRCKEFVGKIYLNGIGVKKDESKGIYLLEKADLGDSYFILGNYFYIKKNIEKSKSYYLKAAKMDHVGSIYNLGVFSQMEKKSKQAINYFQRALIIDAKYYPAILELSRMYIEGWGTGTDYQKAITMLEPVIMNTADEGEKELAIKNISIAEYQLGLTYLNGESENKLLAFLYIQRAANRNNMYAQYELAKIYCRGDGVEKDEEKVIEWYKKAAKQGHTEAQLYLGLRYWEGKGVMKDYEKAQNWLKKSAENGHPQGQMAYGLMMKSINKKESLFWLTKAANQGNKAAKDYLKEISEDGLSSF